MGSFCAPWFRVSVKAVTVIQLGEHLLVVPVIADVPLENICRGRQNKVTIDALPKRRLVGLRGSAKPTVQPPRLQHMRVLPASDKNVTVRHVHLMSLFADCFD